MALQRLCQSFIYSLCVYTVSCKLAHDSWIHIKGLRLNSLHVLDYRVKWPSWAASPKQAVSFIAFLQHMGCVGYFWWDMLDKLTLKYHILSLNFLFYPCMYLSLTELYFCLFSWLFCVISLTSCLHSVVVYTFTGKVMSGRVQTAKSNMWSHHINKWK